ncbi:Probable septum site-determining protein minC [hydrothermal vent metagenome]|uniref:Probable septum site-determining protein minC n=1 Tax=hydrothermal vent metagenome TaxID=652676 RepID=A0A1W1CI44_9ZZZZ
MQTKQYSVKVFEVNVVDEEQTLAFFEKNYVFFRKHLISLHGRVTSKIESYLKEKQLTYIIGAKLHPTKEQKSAAPTSSEVEDNLKVIDKLVRSGQELKIKGDLLLLNRVNSGGTIDIDGNLIVTQIVEGSIRCRGKFMMLKASPKANIVFNDVEVDNRYLQERLNRVDLQEDEIRITPVLKETSWV